MNEVTSVYDQPQPVLRAATATGEQISLRIPAAADAAAIEITCTDSESLRWTTIPLGYDRARALSFISDYAPGWWKRRQGGCWVIADSTDQYVGQIDLRVDQGDPELADVGFVTAPHGRGKGYMTAAMRTVAEYGLRELGLQRVEWKAHVGNVGSRRVAEKAGFQFEGTLRAACPQRGERRDAWLAALLKDDLA
jgi:RimJ/RimL family protein N-acetyltransferase